MVTQELIDNISRRFRQGQTKEEIKQALVDEGWEDIDVDEAIRHIQKAALAQIPIIAKYMDFMANLDKKTAELSPPMVLAVCGVSAIIVLIVAVILYNVIDPFNAKAGIRDTQREQALTQLQAGIQKFFDDKQKYPAQLSELSPKYIDSVPKDPKSNGDYAYTPLDSQLNYELCITFETQAAQCVSSTTSSVIPTVLPSGVMEELNGDVASTITGEVFFDGNGDGKKDTGEAAFLDAPVTITDANQKVICDVKTDRTGTYFCNLPKDGVYQVTLASPVGYRLTSKNPQTVRFPDLNDPSKKNASVMFGVAPSTSAAQQIGR